MKLNANQITGGAYFIVDKDTRQLLNQHAWRSEKAATKVWRMEYKRNEKAVIVPTADAQLFLLKMGY